MFYRQILEKSGGEGMLKNRIAIYAVVVSIAIMAGCSKKTETVTPATPAVSLKGTTNGDALYIIWDEVQGAEGYKITYGTSVKTLYGVTEFTVSDIVPSVKVVAFAGDKESAPFTKDIKVRELNFTWGIQQNDSDTLSLAGLEFKEDTLSDSISLVPVAVTDDNLSNAIIDFIAYKDSVGNHIIPIQAVDTLYYGQYYNNGVAYDDTLTYGNVEITPSAFKMGTVPATNGVFFLKKDHGLLGGDIIYAKMEITSITDSTMTVKIAYQPIPSLRWVK